MYGWSPLSVVVVCELIKLTTCNSGVLPAAIVKYCMVYFVMIPFGFVGSFQLSVIELELLGTPVKLSGCSGTVHRMTNKINNFCEH